MVKCMTILLALWLSKGLIVIAKNLDHLIVLTNRGTFIIQLQVQAEFSDPRVQGFSDNILIPTSSVVFHYSTSTSNSTRPFPYLPRKKKKKKKKNSMF